MRATINQVSLGLLLIALAAAAGAQQIQFAEPIQLSVTGQVAQFDAYGRRFSLTLTDNERVLQKLPAQRKQDLGRYRLLRGSLDGQPGSWVRLTESAAGVEGAIWDGHDLYAVTRYEQAAPFLTTPLAVAPGQTVVYRLSDARDVLPRDFCALDAEAVGQGKLTALDHYRALVGELQDSTAGKVTRQLEIALIADSDFAVKEAPDPEAAMLARFNIVEGIFSEQVGLLVLATDLRVMPGEADPFTSTNGTTLLEQVGNFRAATPAVRARGLAHLMTGKNLDGTTAGIAYLDGVCSVKRGASLSEHSFGTTISALIMAHELGHNFGSPHDGEAGGACASVGAGFIMAPTVSGFATFSRCSNDIMRATLASATCVTSAEYADVALATGASNLAAEGGATFTLPFEVRSDGNETAEEVVFDVTLPANGGITLQSASAEGASCSVADTTATCSFGLLAAGERRAVRVRARPTLAGSVTVRARVSASNERLTSNNDQDVTVVVRSGIDAAVRIVAGASEVALGAPLEIYTEVRSQRALPVRNATLSLNLNQAVSSAQMPGATCSVKQFSVICDIAEIAAGARAELTVVANTTAAGPLIATANVTAPGDGDFSNNNASAQAWVQAARDVEVSAGSASVNLAMGEAYEIPLLVRSRGPLPTGDVTVWISLDSAAVRVDVLDAGGSACTQSDATSWRCELGALASGETRQVRLRVLGTGVATTTVHVMTDADADGYGPNNSAGVQLRIDNVVDLGVLLASGGSGVEDEPISGQVLLRSSGREAATGATLDIDLNAAGKLLSAAIHEGADCVLLAPQRARCGLPAMERGEEIHVNYHAEFADPGSYDVKFTVKAPGDTAPGNDALTRPVLVRPYNDIAVAGTFDLSDFIVGDSRVATFTVTTGRRPLAAARFVARNYLPGVEVTAIQANVGNCSVEPALGGLCEFADLPPGANLRVTVTWQALEGSPEQDVAVEVSTSGDVVADNNQVISRAQVLGRTDVELRVEATGGGASGQTFEFPPISVINGAERAVGTRLEVTLPAGVALVDVSAANAICSGNKVLRCDFADLNPDSTSTVNISVRVNARGNYVSSLKLTSLNDINPANDQGEVALEVSAGTATATTAANGGGGGGSLEWLSLALLGLLVRSRIVHRGSRPIFWRGILVRPRQIRAAENPRDSRAIAPCAHHNGE